VKEKKKRLRKVWGVDGSTSQALDRQAQARCASLPWNERF
jgi:hypothetical protein